MNATETTFDRSLTSDATGHQYRLKMDADLRGCSISWLDADHERQTVDGNVTAAGILLACDVPAEDQGLLVGAVAELRDDLHAMYGAGVEEAS